MLRVLVLDDDPTIVGLCVFALEFEGHEAIGVTDPMEAMDLAKKQHFDVVVLDLMLPGMDGWEVLRELSNDPNTGNWPVLILSADSYNLLRGLTLVARPKVWGLAKPFDVSEFISEVQRLARV